MTSGSDSFLTLGHNNSPDQDIELIRPKLHVSTSSVSMISTMSNVPLINSAILGSHSRFHSTKSWRSYMLRVLFLLPLLLLLALNLLYLIPYGPTTSIQLPHSRSPSLIFFGAWSQQPLSPTISVEGCLPQLSHVLTISGTSFIAL